MRYRKLGDQGLCGLKEFGENRQLPWRRKWCESANGFSPGRVWSEFFLAKFKWSKGPLRQFAVKHVKLKREGLFHEEELG